MMPHGKNFLYGLCGTVQGRLGWAGEEMTAFCPRIEEIVSSTQWLNGADFDTIHYVMRFGHEKQSDVYCRRKPKYQELEVASQESMERLHDVFLNRELLRRFLAAEVKRVFEHIRFKYKLPENKTLFDFLALEAVSAEQGAPADAKKRRG
jgi:Immunity protein 39